MLGFVIEMSLRASEEGEVSGAGHEASKIRASGISVASNVMEA